MYRQTGPLTASVRPAKQLAATVSVTAIAGMTVSRSMTVRRVCRLSLRRVGGLLSETVYNCRPNRHGRSILRQHRTERPAGN